LSRAALPEDGAHASAVTIVAHDAGGSGGMENHLSHVIAGLIDRGYEVTVISRTLRTDRRDGLRWERVRGPARPFVIAYPWFFVGGSILVWRRARGLVHTTGALVGNRADVATVHLCHRGFEESTSLRRASRGGALYRLNALAAAVLSRLAESYCYRPSRTRHLIAVSRGVAEELGRYYPGMAGRVTVIPNGIDRRVFRPDEEARARIRAELRVGGGALLAAFVGGEWSGKGLRHAIDAVAREPRWQLLVVGDGDRTRYGRLADQAGAAGRVHFVGRQPRPASFYAAADAFLLPSVYEAFPLVALEAAASGLPVLATRVNGVTDVLEDGRNGWFIEPDGASIAARLAQLADDEHLRERMGEASRAASAAFEWDAAVDAHVGVYRSLASRPALRDPSVR
jgi:glycosyltransferase involved in cell wall biosynthesis